MRRVTKETLHIYFAHTMRYKWQFWLLFVLVVCTSVIDALLPTVEKNLIDTVAGSTGSYIQARNLVLLIAGIGLIKQMIWRVVIYLVINIEAPVMSNLMNTSYDYLLGHSYGYFVNNFVGSIVTRVRRQQGSYERIVDVMLFEFVRTLFRIPIIFVVLFTVHAVFGWVILIWALAYITFAVMVNRYKMTVDIKRAEQDTKTTAKLADTLTNNLNIKLFANSEYESQGFKQVTQGLCDLRMRSWLIHNKASFVQGTAVVSLYIVNMFLALRFWALGQMSVGEIYLLISYMNQVSERLWDISRHMRNVYESLAEAQEMTESLLTPHEVTDVHDAVDLKVTAGEVEFKDVTFGYNLETPVLSNFNLMVKPGKKLALVGPSGGGKTTVTKLILRLKDVGGGQILVDGQDISLVTQDSLRQAVSLVPQEPSLFHRSLMENIRYGRLNATDEEVMAAAKAAHAHEFISTMPLQYHTLVGERGVKLSGGERQRVAIARAILKDAPILVLDEATSSLDSESEQLIQDALTHLMAGRTTIVIAHRLSTIQKMDEIVVIENGAIKERGTHQELVESDGGTYQRLWEIQVGGFGSPTYS